ncbi:MAG: 16S rRNA (cytidine(1402)-2'-O)-methyltransferase [Flavobacteriales bacterium]
MSTLFVVPTPIGNLEDITLRALRVLKECDFIIAEDTRETRKLLQHFNIDKPLLSYHLNNEHHIVKSLTERILGCQSAALVSDAGTPAISDPGFLLVRECLSHGVEVFTLPGATAFVPALVQSGLPCEKFVYEGFLPHKKGRETRFKAIAEEDRTTVLYESPHRLIKALEQIVAICGGERQIAVSREISKKFEETVRGSAQEVLEHFQKNEPRGEFVMVIAGKS